MRNYKCGDHEEKTNARQFPRYEIEVMRMQKPYIKVSDIALGDLCLPCVSYQHTTLLCCQSSQHLPLASPSHW